MLRKGQSATEYLIVLAVVIVIALLVVVAVGDIPGIGVSTTGRASQAFWSSTDIAITNYAIDAAGTSNVYVLKNNNNFRVTITNFKIGTTTVEATDHILAAGASIKLADTELDAHVDCGNAGDAYRYDVEITYTDDSTGSSHTVTGDGVELEGSCSG